MTSSLSNLILINNEYIVTSSNAVGVLTINQPATVNYLLQYQVNVPANRLHDFSSRVGDNTSNIQVRLNGSNLSVNSGNSNIFSNFIPSSYLITGINTLTTNRIDDSMFVSVNNSNILRITNSNQLPTSYFNSTIVVSASNSTRFRNVIHQPTAVTNSAMVFTKPIKATSITASNVSACNIDVITSNIHVASNVAVWSSNNLLNKAGGTVTGSLSVNGNVGIGTTNPAYKLDVSGSNLRLKAISSTSRKPRT